MNQEIYYSDNETEKSARMVVAVVYALQAISVLLGGITFFLLGGLAFVLAVVAIVINYVKRDDARGTWLESHFTWQIYTFWFSLLLTIVAVVTLPLLGTGWFVAVITVVWVIYRIVKGWLRLSERREMYD
uniref:Uncharacterized membrane protein n=1 Tax=Candidatus Kentrum sp. DK TaxID=2126562 RepID=A0A450TK89_9GAMM|nr:MAG: Uncharacterized membrane protein [Candidatus Kentron sp. DK]VFJ67952.1 MAG: Uncharacterized membrane protein [Candidatus Kentron sp. DK]